MIINGIPFTIWYIIWPIRYSKVVPNSLHLKCIKHAYTNCIHHWFCTFSTSFFWHSRCILYYFRLKYDINIHLKCIKHAYTNPIHHWFCTFSTSFFWCSCCITYYFRLKYDISKSIKELISVRQLIITVLRSFFFHLHFLFRNRLWM